MPADSAPMNRATTWGAGAVVAVITVYIACPVLFILPAFLFQRMGVVSAGQSKEYARSILRPLMPLSNYSPTYNNLVEQEFRHDPTGLVQWSLRAGAARMRRAAIATPPPTPRVP